MTPQFYARYVPPSGAVNVEEKNDDLEESRPAKKRKKQDVEGLKQAAVPGNVGPNIVTRSGAVPSALKMHKNKHKAPKSDLPLTELTRNVTSVQQNGILSLSSQKCQEPALEASLGRTSGKPQRGADNRDSDLVGDENQQEQSISDGTKKKKKKKKKDRQEDHTTTEGKVIAQRDSAVANAQVSSQSKHVNVLSKYEKSLKTAANVAEIESSRAQPDVKESTPPRTHGLVPLPQPPQVPDPLPPSPLSGLPTWMTEPITASSIDTLPFNKLLLSQAVTDTLQAKGFSEAFAIQAAVLPLLLPGEKQHLGDLCIAASTGSGKTLAYALPMVEALRNKPITKLRGLVVVPTRELVNQAHEILEMCSSGSGLKIGTAFGSKTLKEEQEAFCRLDQRYDPVAYQQKKDEVVDEDEELLNWDEDQFVESLASTEKLVGYVDDYQSRIDILVCTPGRLIEHLQHTRGFTLDHVEWLVVDEADRLLDESFQQWVDNIMPALEHQDPPSAAESTMIQRFHLLRKRVVRKVILSATMTRDVSKLKELNLRRPRLVLLRGDQWSKHGQKDADEDPSTAGCGERIELPPTLHEIAVQIKDEENKPLYLIELLKELSSTRSRGSTKQLRQGFGGLNCNDDSDSSQSAKSTDDEPMSDTTSSSGSPSSVGASASVSDSDISMEDLHPNPLIEKMHGSLVFAHSTSSAHRLSRLLSILTPQEASAVGTMTKSSAKSSKRILSQFRDGKINTIICTDRASRGLDIPNLATVINYDMPPSISSYVHRVGRTARAGKAGTAITLVGWREGRWFWNEIGRGQAIARGNRKITRKTMNEEGWDDDEKQKYSDALKQLGEETRGEGP
ncbi:MAG: hypothetical protein L6R40_000801 [Gallowayella cf. fulva]|nr:MAG: hypothetical protein L6R40_000801 [Xanthomendoza cf. fulva]